jgi:hypothetical protein
VVVLVVVVLVPITQQDWVVLELLVKVMPVEVAMRGRTRSPVLVVVAEQGLWAQMRRPAAVVTVVQE